jgi:tRNA (mo5U34)-methyltransferase
MSLVAHKRLRLGGIEFDIAMDEARADRLRRSAPYRYVLRPALNRLHGLTNGDDHQNGRQPFTVAPVVHPPQQPASPEARAIIDRIAGVDWYHTIELPHGVATPGFTDHRPQVPLYGLPDDMRGLRALDVATYDGFWSFEMERRGAEVSCIDIGSWAEFDIPRAYREELRKQGTLLKPTGVGFAIAHELLQSTVQRHVLSVYDLSPERMGHFDVVFLSDLLLHLRDPQRALEAVCSVVRPGGSAIIADVYNPALEPFVDMNVTEFMGFAAHVWWRPSIGTLKTMMRLAGFARVEERGRFLLAATTNDPIHKVVLRGYLA